MVYDFGLRLKELREKKHLSQTLAAEKLGITRSTISAYERNTKTPRLETLIKIAVLYNSLVDYILGLSHQTNLYLDDVGTSQQRTIIDIVERLKQEFLQNRQDR